MQFKRKTITSLILVECSALFHCIHCSAKYACLSFKVHVQKGRFSVPRRWDEDISRLNDTHKQEYRTLQGQCYPPTAALKLLWSTKSSSLTCFRFGCPQSSSSYSCCSRHSPGCSATLTPHRQLTAYDIQRPIETH